MRIMKIEGLPVKDAKKSVALHITAADVKKGKIKNPSSCAAAVACVRSLGATEAHVHIGRTYLRFNGHWQRYLTSAALRAEVVAFDRGGKFEPGEYHLIKIQPSRKGDKSRDKRKNQTSKKRLGYHVLTNIRPMALVS